jgi:choline dehydrogenase
VTQVGYRTPTFENTDLPALDKPNDCITLGAFVSPSWINSSNLTHFYAKSAYIDPVLHRLHLPNLSVLVITRIIFWDGSGDLTATGVEFAVTADGPRQTVSAEKEVIFVAGVLGSPQISISRIVPANVPRLPTYQLGWNCPALGNICKTIWWVFSVLFCEVDLYLFLCMQLASVVWNSTAEMAP